MKEIKKEDLKLINGGSEASYDLGKSIGIWFGKVVHAIDIVVDAFSPAS